MLMRTEPAQNLERLTRQLSLGGNLDTDHIQATNDAGVLTLRIPVAAEAEPRKIEISAEPDH
jgi:HSP20 family protein